MKATEAIYGLYHKIAPLADEGGFRIDLDIQGDTELGDDFLISPELKEVLAELLKNADQSTSLTFSYKNGELKITNSNMELSKATCKKLSSEKLKISSRLGFGTTVRIKL